MESDIIRWLLQGDPAVRFQTYRDLLGLEYPEIQKRILKEGWGKQYLNARKPDGTWGDGYYRPKWTCTHYTLLDLYRLNAVPDDAGILPVIRNTAVSMKANDGGINAAKTVKKSDLCICGMFLSAACWASLEEELLESVIDFILSQQMEDGGFNCMANKYAVSHSSLHTTISVLEGIREYQDSGYQYRMEELEQAAQEAEEWMLKHRLFKSDRTGKVIRQDFLSLIYPYRWKYTILRALDYFRMRGAAFDLRMEDALEQLVRKRRKDGRWVLHVPPKGSLHFHMEQPGEPSRWITLIALRVLSYYGRG